MRSLSKFFPKQMRSLLKKTILKDYWVFKPAFSSFANCGEDRVLAYLFKGKNEGVYVDIGAHHPISKSNTYYFYLLGWRGINVDAYPGKMEGFKKLRPRDINREQGVGEKTGSIPFYIIDGKGSPMNSFNKKNIVGHGIDPQRITSRNIQIATLESILQEHLNNSAIDFLTVDVEGYELEVLKSNNWEKFRPKVILVEGFFSRVEEVINSKITTLLKTKEYRLAYVTPNNIYYLEKGLELSSINQIN